MASNGCYFTLNLLYGLGSVCAIMIGAAFFNYDILVQAALVAVILLPWGCMLSALEPDTVSGRVRRKPRVIFIVTSVLSLTCLFIALIYPIETLASKCSQEQNFSRHSLDVTVRYSTVDAATGLSQEHDLLLEYNLTERRVVHSVEVVDTVHDQQQKTWLEKQVVRHQLAQKETVCTGPRVSRFHLLSDEVEQALRDRHHAANHAASVRVSPHHSDDQGYEQLNHLRQRLRVREICRYEYGAAILYICFIAALAVLEIFTLCWYTFQVRDDGGK